MMAKKKIHIKSIGAKLNDQGEEVLRSMLEAAKDVVIGASAGTGKTTLLTNILAETIIRKMRSSKSAPLDSIIAATFTVEASRQMRKKTREILTAYHKKHPLPNFDALIYNLETGSWITTIDSLTQRIIRMVALDIGLPPEVGIIDEYDNSQLLSEVLDDLTIQFPSDIEFLELATRKRTRELLTNALSNLSLYIIDHKVLLKRVRSSFTRFYSCDLGLGQDKQDVRSHNARVMKSIARILPVFVQKVREKYRKEGSYTYDELRRLVVEFLRSSNAIEWREYFGNRFKFLLIDEFQDTSVAQTELLSQIVGPDTRIMLIGDPKQSIYTWRNAEPTILAGIISAAKKGTKDIHFGRRFQYHPITRNFRSVKPLVELTNYLFSEKNDNSLFEETTFTRGLSLPNPEIEAQSPCPLNEPEDSPHIHHFFTGSRKRKQDEKFSEWEFVAHLLGKLANGKLDVRVRKEINGTWSWIKPKLGDCSVLIRGRGKPWKELRKLLIKQNIPYVMIQDQGFYQRPEISLLIDFLDWLGDPYQNDALLRILRSPFVGASDFLLRTLASMNFRFGPCITELEKKHQASKNKSKVVIVKRGLLALKRVMNLKRNLRWSREGRKAVLLEAILQSSHFREILMTYPEGEQCVANLGMMCDIVDSWEAEEIISYQELVGRLKYYRASSPANQSQAVLSDLENEGAVKVSTIHATKGLEFPIVFMLDVDFQISRVWWWSNSGRRGTPARLLYSGAGGKFIHIRQLAPPRASYDLWSGISDIYAKEPKTKTGFRKNLAGIYDEFFAEKWRLYYVALTRARDHIFHGYNFPQATSLTWGNEFRSRVSKFVESDTERTNWVSHIDGPPTPVKAKASPSQVINYVQNKILQRIGERFHPLVVDPTHVYDLLLCPRRYQYGSLMGATGAKCNDTGHSQFSPLFGGILHEMLERYDYTSHDATQSLEYLGSKDYVSKRDQDLLREAVRKYADFVRANLGHLDGSTHCAISEKRIHACLNVSGRSTELRGVIDLLEVSENTINIYDIKSNYLNSSTNDSIKIKLRKEFMRHHHEYQLLTYKAMLENQGYRVDGVYVLAISKSETGDLQWVLVDVKSNLQITEELKNAPPPDVGEGGLPTKKNKFCPICEYRYMCRDIAPGR